MPEPLVIVAYLGIRHYEVNTYLERTKAQNTRAS